MKITAVLMILFFTSVSILSIATEGGAGDKPPAPHDKDHEEEEENSAVGPDKGILEFHDDEGFKLSPEAAKSFGVSFIPLKLNKGTFEAPKTVLLEAQGHSYVYRERAGFLKRVQVEVLKHDGGVTARSSELAANDRILATGVAFVRIAELNATGATPHGH